MDKKDARITLFKEYFTNVDGGLMDEFKKCTNIKKMQNWIIRHFDIQFDFLMQDKNDISYAVKLLERAHYSKREWMSEQMRNEIKKTSKEEMLMVQFGLRKICVNGQILVYQRNQLLSKKCKEEIGYWDIEETDPMTFKSAAAANNYLQSHFAEKEGVQIYETSSKNYQQNCQFRR